MIGIKHIGAAAFTCLFVFMSGQVLAVPITVSGTTVSFAFDSALVGLFGTPTVAGDSLFFTPTTFKAQSSSNAGFVITSQTFNVAVTANAGYQIAGANLTESGDYFNINTNFNAFEGVGVSGQLILRNLESPFTPAASANIATLSPLTALTTFPVGFSSTNWTATASVGVPLGWGGEDGIASAVNVTIENILAASSLNAASSAFIEKKFAGFEIVTTPVPEAQTYAMMLVGLGLVGFVVRRSRAV
jgi:hypothetical protein